MQCFFVHTFQQVPNNERNKQQGKGKKDSEIIEEASRCLFDHYVAVVCERVASSDELEQLSPGVGQVLVDHLRAVLIVRRVCARGQEDLVNHMSQFEAQLCRKYKIRSRIRQWLNEHMDNERKRYVAANRFTAHQRAIDECKAANLYQAAYFLQRDLNFIRDVRLVCSAT